MSKDTKFKPGQSGNPNGRPPKSRALTDLLEKALNKTIAVAGEDKRAARKRIIAENVAQAVATGSVKMPDGKQLELSPRDWMEFTKWLYAHVDGAPKQQHELSGADGRDLIFKVAYDDDGGKLQDTSPEVPPETS